MKSTDFYLTKMPHQFMSFCALQIEQNCVRSYHTYFSLGGPNGRSNTGQQNLTTGAVRSLLLKRSSLQKRQTSELVYLRRNKIIRQDHGCTKATEKRFKTDKC